MAFPRKLLADHEELILDLRPHWVALVWPIAQTLFALVALVAAIVYTPDDWPDWVVWAELLLFVVFVLAYPLRHVIAWLTSHFVLTSDRLIRREGWFAKSSMEIPLERINDVRFHQSIFERMIGAGDLTIESAGERGQEVFPNIRHPESVQKQIYETSERNQNRMMTPGDWRGPSGTTERLEEFRTTETVNADAVRAPNTVEALERLADLRERGVINEAEFQEEKARILGDQPG
ncbi:MAG: PH domain-containing protein [Actinobacteria bacterium]|nr:PH domain-containing protein [Actinomycetota bacterium]